jgi:hypothetical protein
MKKLVLFVLVTIVSLNLNAQNDFPTSKNSNVTIDGGYINLIKPESTSNWARGLRYKESDLTTFSGIGLYGSGSTPIRLYMAHGTSPWSSGLGMYILPNGNTGIGTSSPETKLHVKDGIVKAGTLGSTNGTLQFAGNYSGNNILNTYGSQYSTGATCIGYAVKQKSGSSGIVSSAGNSSFVRGMLIIDNKLEFLSADASTTAIDNDLNLTSRFFINAAGNVGIGTTAPDSKLQVIQSSNENWATKIYNGEVLAKVY